VFCTILLRNKEQKGSERQSSGDRITLDSLLAFQICRNVSICTRTRTQHTGSMYDLLTYSSPQARGICQATPWHTRTEMCGEKEEGEGVRHLRKRRGRESRHLRSDGLDSDGFRYHTLVARSHTHLLIGLQYGCRHRKHRLKQARPEPQHACTRHTNRNQLTCSQGARHVLKARVKHE